MNVIDWMMNYESGGKDDGAPHRDPADPGGATQWGISSKYNPTLAPLIKRGKLSKTTARSIYARLYNRYTKYGVIDQRIHFYLFDRAVHGHVKDLVRLIQTLINGYEAFSLRIDGAFGPNTARALQRLTVWQRDAIVQSIAAIYPSWLYEWGADTGHSDGFLNRAQQVSMLALSEEALVA
jgi:lysozyme family protein